MDGDSVSGAFYEYGVTTLISDKSRVIKGGSWNDRPYWLSPGHAGSWKKTNHQVQLVSVALKLIWVHLKAWL